LNDHADLETMLRRVIREELREFEKEKKAKVFSAPHLWITLQAGQWTNVTEERMHAWQTAYPLIDLRAELLKAASYAAHNRSRAPNGNMQPFLNRWMKRAQARVASERSRPPSAATPLLVRCDNAPGCSRMARVRIIDKETKREHDFCAECADRFHAADLASWVAKLGGA
jgi:hypothetical protein